MKTPDVDLLITKSIKARVVEVHDPSRQNRVQGAAMLQAFSDVAADVLDLCIAPGGWRIAVAVAVRESGDVPRWDAADVRSIERYEAWIEGVVGRVRSELGLDPLGLDT